MKVARLAGLGTDAVREVAVDDSLRMRADDLAARLAVDRADGYAPFLVVATAGPTRAPAIDPFPAPARGAQPERIRRPVQSPPGGPPPPLPPPRRAPPAAPPPP